MDTAPTNTRRFTLDEIRVRGAQALSAFAERRGWSSLTRLPPDQDFLGLLDQRRLPREIWSAREWLEHLRTRTTPTFFAAFADRRLTVEMLSRLWPDRKREVVIAAEKILAGRFDLLGLNDLDFGDPIDWHLDPVSRKRAPLRHWSKLDYLDHQVAGDKKIIWELNRHQYFVTLGNAYWLTDDERFAQAFTSHLLSWMERNPPKLGINWASSLEVAFRAISWLWGIYFFKDSAAMTARVFMPVMKYLYLHARHLETYLSTYFSPNTHLTGEALGLFYIGTLLPEFLEAVRWRETGRSVLLEQLPRHVQPDGVYFEQSSYYHRYTTDFYTHFLILERLNGAPGSPEIPPEVAAKLTSLLDHLMYITRPDGTTPLFGDDDGGRLLMLDRRASNDFRPALATGAALFGRPDYKFVAAKRAEETLWLLGPSGADQFEHLVPEAPAQTSKAFENGGYYVMRDSWSRDANFLLMDCGPHGMANCGHAHADALGFDLSAAGETMLVDPGTYTYTGSADLRDGFRSSTAHNALIVDGQSSSIPGRPFSWRSIAHCQVERWLSRPGFDYFSGSHDGYQRLSAPVKHSRSVLFLKGNYWIFRDAIDTAGHHEYQLRFHCDRGISAQISPSGVRIRGAQAALQLSVFAPNGTWRTESGDVSHCYGEKAPARVCVLNTAATGTFDVITFMIPGAEADLFEIKSRAATGGKVFELIGQSARDLVMIGNVVDVQSPEADGLASDFAWVWARFANDGARLEELVAIAGRNLVLNGDALVQSDQRLQWITAQRDDDQFLIETEAGTRRGRLPVVSVS